MRTAQERADRYVDWALKAESDARWARVTCILLIGGPSLVPFAISHGDCFALCYFGAACFVLGLLFGWVWGSRHLRPKRVERFNV